MELLVEKNRGVFNTEIKKGTLIWAKHDGWEAGIGGFVSAVTENKLVVMFHPDISNVINHYIIHAEEVSDGKWMIRWSEDLVTVNEFPEGKGVEDETGRTDTEEDTGEPGPE